MTATTEGLWTAVGGIIDETRVTLTLQGADLDPAAVTALAGVEPTRSHRRGEALGPGREEMRQYGDWVLEVNVNAPEDAELALAKLFASLPGDAFWNDLTAKYRTSLTLMMVVKAWNRGFQLSASTLQEVARRGLTLSFDVYAEPQQLPSACFA